MPDFKVVNPLDIPHWDTLVSDFRDANSFHTTGWLRTLVDTYQYRPQYATWWDGTKLTRVFPIVEVESILTGKRGVSLPFTDFCPFLCESSCDTQTEISALLDLGKLRGWRYLETREAARSDVEGNGSGLSYLMHTLDLTQGLEPTMRRLRSSARRNIKRAEREGVRIIEENTLKGIDEFCRLNVIRRKDHGLPPQPKRFFENLFRNVIDQGNGKIFLADFQGEFIAGIVCLSFNGQAIFKYGASDMRYQILRANNLLMWEAISTYCNNDYRNFNFGKTETDHIGLLQFKRGWGTIESGIHYLKYDMKSGKRKVEVFSNEKFYNPIFSRMPIFLLNFTGRLFYRHMG